MISSRDGLSVRNKTREAEWNVCRHAAIARDGFQCVTEKLTARGWSRCAARSTETGHVYKRQDCGKAWAWPTVVGRVCTACHRALHRFDPNVRWPIEVRRRAYDALVTAHEHGLLHVLPAGGRP